MVPNGMAPFGQRITIRPRRVQRGFRRLPDLEPMRPSSTLDGPNGPPYRAEWPSPGCRRLQDTSPTEVTDTMYRLRGHLAYSIQRGGQPMMVCVPVISDGQID